MIRTTVGSGRTVEEAIEAACTELGCSRDQIEFEILTLAKKSFFGLRVTPAQVRVSYDDGVPEPKAQRPKDQRRPQDQRRPEGQQRPQAQRRPKDQRRPEDQPRPEDQRHPPEPKTQQRPEGQRRPAEQRPSAAEVPAPKAAEPAPAAPAVPTAQENGTFLEEIVSLPPLTDEIPDAVRPKAEAAVDYLTGVIRAMGVENFTVTPKMREDTLVLMIEGRNIGVVIGRRGETLNALQTLTGLAANQGERREDGAYVRVNLDSGHYREKRNRTLEELATKVALNAVRTGRSTTLEPMNPFDRRIIHAAVARVEGAVSTSVGNEPTRRVVISSANPRRSTDRDSRSGDRRSRSGSRGSSRGDRRYGDRRRDSRPRDGRPAQQPEENTAPAKQPLKEAADQPLYGKIEL